MPSAVLWRTNFSASVLASGSRVVPQERDERRLITEVRLRTIRFPIPDTGLCDADPLGNVALEQLPPPTNVVADGLRLYRNKDHPRGTIGLRQHQRHRVGLVEPVQSHGLRLWAAN